MAISRSIRPFEYSLIGPESGGPPIVLDPDAAIFINAGSFSSPQQVIINQLFLDFKTGLVNGLNNWTNNIIAGWPIVGGTAANHALDIKRFKDLTWINSPVHSATGALLNGTSQYAQTGLNASTDMPVNDGGMGAYLGSDSASSGSNQTIIGASNGTNSLHRVDGRLIADGSIRYAAYDVSLGVVDVVSQTNNGFLYGCRIASNIMNFYKNSTPRIGTNGNGITSTPPSLELYLGAANSNGTPINFTDNELRFGIVTTGLTEAEYEDLNAAIQVFQTSLGRNSS